MSAEDAVQRLNMIRAHAWMVRTCLKHADAVQDNWETRDVPRPAYARGPRRRALRCVGPLGPARAGVHGG